MLCDICGATQATVHLTEIVDEQMTELHLCEECAKNKSMDMEQQFGLADLLAGLTDIGKTQLEDKEAAKLKCAICGLSYEDFRKIGRLGCSECYSSFREYLGPLLKKIHGSSQHLGKHPLKLGFMDKEKIEDLQELKNQLQQAIQNENFEEAARLRDKIHQLEKRGN